MSVFFAFLRFNNIQLVGYLLFLEVFMFDNFMLYVNADSDGV